MGKTDKNITNVNELEVVDNKYYISRNVKYTNNNTKETTVKSTFVFAPSAKVIKMNDFNDFEFFIEKKEDDKWVISEAITGTYVYKSPISETKGNALKNANELITTKVKNGNGLMEVINNKIKITGISPRYRK